MTPHTEAPLWARSATDLARAVAAGEVSSAEVVEAHLARAAAVDPAINALTRVLGEEAREAAARADERVAQGLPLGPLHGVPVTIKDNVDVRGWPTTQGVSDGPETVAALDAPVVARLRAAGAVVIAKTNLPDLGARVHTHSKLHGTTINPWNPDITASGSSGGEAAAIATGMSPLGIGNDSGGSLRNPSNACGITCIKPTAGLVPQASSIEPTDLSIVEQLVTVNGVMARSVEDLDRGLRIIMGASRRDPTSQPFRMPDPPSELPRVAVLPEPPGGPTDPVLAAAVRRAADLLASAGYPVEEVTPPDYEEVTRLWGPLVLAELRNGRAGMDDVACADALRFLDLLDPVYPETTLASFLEATARRNGYARRWSEFLADHPLVLSPVWAQRPFAVGEDLSGPDAVARIQTSLRPVLPANVLGLPAAVVPTEVVDGLPVAVQVMGDRLWDFECIEAARVLEARTGALTPIDPVGRAATHA